MSVPFSNPMVALESRLQSTQIYLDHIRFESTSGDGGSATILFESLDYWCHSCLNVNLFRVFRTPFVNATRIAGYSLRFDSRLGLLDVGHLRQRSSHGHFVTLSDAVAMQQVSQDTNCCIHNYPGGGEMFEPGGRVPGGYLRFVSRDQDARISLPNSNCHGHHA